MSENTSMETNGSGRFRSPTGYWNMNLESSKLWRNVSTEEPLESEAIQHAFARHVYCTLARTPTNMDNFGAYQGVAYTLRDRLIKRWNRTQTFHTAHQPKRIYYLSMEFLMGRSLSNTVLNLDVDGPYREALHQLGYELEDLYEEEQDAALGNGGLGRLAACYMDSLASMDYPAWGYGLRYNYGIFEQRIVNGYQVEFPDYWLTFGNPWEIPRLDVTYPVHFYGTITKRPPLNATTSSANTNTEPGANAHDWRPGETVLAVAYDYPVPGFRTKTTLTIRLWSSKPSKQFDLASFNEGNYEKSVEEQQRAENITSVLYPNDNTLAGKELRLKQQYFFVCATLQDIIRRFKKSNLPWQDFPRQVAIQLNDTHPALGIVELLRILVDDENVAWDDAWKIITSTYSFTNHTVLPEALEKWPVSMMQTLLPRHMKMIFDINLFFLQYVEQRFPGDRDRLRRMSIIEEGVPQMVRMAHLAIVGSHTVNGVAAIHTMLLKTTIFRDFVELFGEGNFQNKTNGITPRRWLHLANPSLSALITETLGKAWLKDLSQLTQLRAHADDRVFQERWMSIKFERKVMLAQQIKERCHGIIISPHALFDVQVKRIHEYKRQLMNILGIVRRYLALKAMSSAEKARAANEGKLVPRVCIFGGKAAPGYYMAKAVIQLINQVASHVNHDSETNDWMQVCFIPNYNVSLAEKITPASDLSEHISLAGTEASGTSNMKFVLNGGLIIGTLDGANVEIKESIGDDNIFIFGLTADKVNDVRHTRLFRKTPMNPELKLVVDTLRSGQLGNMSDMIVHLLDTLNEGNDHYLISDDFSAYLEAQSKVDVAYSDKKGWAKKSIMCTAGMGMFSSDRSIMEYANQIWKIKPIQIQ